jgi:hypothetical protein
MPGPKTGFTGFVRYGVQTGKGTPATTFTPLWVSDVRANPRSGLREVPLTGGIYLHEGMSDVEISLTIEGVYPSAMTFLRNGVRNSLAETLPYLTIQVGDKDGGWQVLDCKIERISWGIEGGAYLTARVTIRGGRVSSVAGFTMPTLTEKPLVWVEASWSAAEVSGVDIDLDNNLTPRSVIIQAGGTAPTSRVWDYLFEGIPRITGRVRGFMSMAGDVQKIGLTPSDLTLRFVRGTNTYEIKLTNAYFTEETWDIRADREQEFEAPVSATGLVLTLPT